MLQRPVDLLLINLAKGREEKMRKSNKIDFLLPHQKQSKSKLCLQIFPQYLNDDEIFRSRIKEMK
jgi:hypothetical protein